MKNKGFSLVELMMVMGVISVVAASAIPSLVKTLPERRLKRAAWLMYMDLQGAKALSVSRNIPVEITVNNDLEQYVVWADENRNGLREAREKTITSLDHLPDVDFYGYPDKVVFSPTGTCTLPDSFNYYFRMQVSIPSVGTKLVYTFPNGHIDPLWIQEAL